MIELVFVIVILGILAAVSIPRLTATRDDAEIAKMAANYTTLVNDIAAYYTSQGKIADGGIPEMTNVVVYDANHKPLTSGTEGYLISGNKKCIHIKIEVETETKRPTYIYSEPRANKDDPVCAAVLALDAVKAIMYATVNAEVYTQGVWKPAMPAGKFKYGYQISGNGVVF